MPDLSSLWALQFPIPPHAVMAFAAFALGSIQLIAAKGTRFHRVSGYVWASLMAGIALTGLLIHDGVRAWGKYSPIHLLIPVVLISLWCGIGAARQGKIRRHRTFMLLLFFCALVVTGLFTLTPGRALHQVFFGGR